MTPPNRHDRSDATDNGLLPEPVGVDTAGISILNSSTSHVRLDLTLPPEEEDDDVVDDDIVDTAAFGRGGPAASEKPSDHDGWEIVDAEVVENDGAPEVDPDDAELDAELEADVIDGEVDAADHESESGEEEEEEASGGAVFVRETPSPSAEAQFGDTGLITIVVPTPMDSAPLTRAQARIQTGPQPRVTQSAVEEPGISESEPSAADDDGAGETLTPVRAAAPEQAVRPQRESGGAPASRRIGDITQNADRESPDLLTAERLLDRSRLSQPEPEGAWSHFFYSLSGGRINLGDSKRVRARKALDARIAAQMSGGARFVTVLSRKGGVGKTAVTTLLGMALADAREDRVIAIDANPDRGTLADRIERSSGGTVRDLVRERERLSGYNDVSVIVARDQTRLDVLASDDDPLISQEFTDEEYVTVAEVASHYYSIVLTDTGTGIVHSVTGAALDHADQLIIVAGTSIDQSRLASETLSWLEQNGYADRVREAIVVLNTASPGPSLVRPDEIEAHFRTRVRDVIRVPYDPQIATGGAISFPELDVSTREAARTLAATVVERLREAV